MTYFGFVLISSPWVIAIASPFTWPIADEFNPRRFTNSIVKESKWRILINVHAINKYITNAHFPPLFTKFNRVHKKEETKRTIFYIG
jgi:hypothetical protein